eukprot:5357387-Amphidinium_carterae.2
MAFMIDSQAVFQAHVKELNIPDEAYEALKARGWHTYCGLSFSTAFAPNQNEDAHFQEVVLTAILGAGSPHESALRRLWVESQ